MALVVSFVILMASWARATGLQVKYGLKHDAASPRWDWTYRPFIKFCFVILLTGIAYAVDQMMVMWAISAFSNQPKLLARYCGFFKGVLSAGLCIAFVLEAGGVSYMSVVFPLSYQ